MVNNNNNEQTQGSNKISYQIKAEELTGGLFCFYLEKARPTQQPEQLCYRRLFRKFKTSRMFREDQFGISFIASRRDSDGNILRTCGGLPWYLYIARKEDVYDFLTWAEHVEWRLNYPDIRNNYVYFHHLPSMAKLTSVSEHNDLSEDIPHKLDQVCSNADVMSIVCTLFDLWDVKIRTEFLLSNSTTVPLGDFFLDEQQGKSRLIQWLRDTYDKTT